MKRSTKRLIAGFARKRKSTYGQKATWYKEEKHRLGSKAVRKRVMTNAHLPPV